MKFPVLLRPVAVTVHLVAVALIALGITLGMWQLESWQEQRDDGTVDRSAREPVALSEALGPDDPFPQDAVSRPVTVSGTWLPESTLYVEGRASGDETGYWVMTPLAVTDDGADAASAPALLVVRGWVADLEPRPEAPRGEASLAGWLQPPEGSTGLDDTDRSDDVIPQVRLADAIQHVDQDLYGGFAVVDLEADNINAGTDGLVPVGVEEVPEVGATTGVRNLLYGLEWWIFSGFAAFIWLRWCRDELLRSRAEEIALDG
ncbi:SURF1 family protein [Nocardioides sp. Y6]|uniref:SURF1-like protein n=1 Tax=Nocardioides malaquae TaxID=2773426 RepID=A0ABR9RXN5_9ACTN|nr:SURF1 family protein [Nocardioides malaquae]MBE7325967.1 SURF1 family protein [Nocardioides malaquae]